MTYPIGTKIKLGHLTIEKTEHGWFDSGCNEVMVDESKIGDLYTLLE